MQEKAVTLPEICWKGVFSTYREAVKDATEACDEYHFVCLLAICGTLLGRRVSITYARPLYPNFYIVLVGESAITRKTTAMRLAEDIGTQFEEIKRTHGISSAEGLLLRLGAFQPGKEEECPGHRALLVIEEFASLLRKARQDAITNLPPVLCEIFDSPARIDLPTRKRPLVVLEPFLSILAGTTPEWLQSSLNEEEATGGFANRFIFIRGMPKPAMPFPRGIDEQKLAEVVDSLREVDDYWQGNRRIRLDQRASCLWSDFYCSWRAKKYPGILPVLMERLPEYALKAALVFAALDKRERISGENMEIGCSFADFLDESIGSVFSFFPLAERGKVEAKILSLLNEENPRSRSEIHQMISGRVKANELNYILKGLATLDRISEYKDAKGKTWVRLIS